MAVQIAGLTIHALDRIDLQRLGESRDIAVRAMGLYRSIALTPSGQRGSLVGATGPDRRLDHPAGGRPADRPAAAGA